MDRERTPLITEVPENSQVDVAHFQTNHPVKIRPMVVPVLRHPSLWIEGLKSVVRMAPNGWWKRRPFLPIPSSSYWHFRMVTVFGGDGSGRLDEQQVIGFLRWSRRMGRGSS